MINVYQINEEVDKQDITDEKTLENINDRFLDMLGEDLAGKVGERYHYKIPEEPHFLVDLYNNHDIEEKAELEKELYLIAKKLLGAELIKSKEKKRRNQKIKQGILIIKIDSGKIYFLKLEETKSIDMNNFSEKPSYSADKQYYKAAIYSGVKDDVIVIDKGNQVAKFWANDFLSLTQVRDSKINTQILIKSIQDESIVNQDLSVEEKDKVLNSLIRFVKSNSSFSFKDVSSKLIDDLNYNDTKASISSVFNEDVLNKMDSAFNLDEEKFKLFKVRINVSDNLFVESKDFYDSISKNEITINNVNQLVISIKDSQVSRVKDLIERYSNDEQNV